MQHLNTKKRQAIKRICEDYQDIFHLEGNSLTWVPHETLLCLMKSTYVLTLVNVKPYRFPEKHKTEVNRQIKIMLKGEIIRTSVSQWNLY